MKERKARAKQRQKLDAVVDKVRDKKNPKAKESKERALKSVVKAGKGVRVIGGSGKQKESKITLGGGSLKL
jgi:hypothetical protein